MLTDIVFKLLEISKDLLFPKRTCAVLPERSVIEKSFNEVELKFILPPDTVALIPSDFNDANKFSML